MLFVIPQTEVAGGKLSIDRDWVLIRWHLLYTWSCGICQTYLSLHSFLLTTMAPLDDPTSDTERTEEDYDELEFPLSDLWHLDDMAAGEIKKDDLFLAYFDVPFSLHQLYTLSLLEPYYRTACERKAVKEFWREFCSIWAMYWREPSTKVRRVRLALFSLL